MDFKQELAKALSQETKLDQNQIELLIETPPEGLGELAFPCFTLSKELKKSPDSVSTPRALLLYTAIWLHPH